MEVSSGNKGKGLWSAQLECFVYHYRNKIKHSVIVTGWKWGSWTTWRFLIRSLANLVWSHVNQRQGTSVLLYSGAPWDSWASCRQEKEAEDMIQRNMKVEKWSSSHLKYKAFECFTAMVHGTSCNISEHKGEPSHVLWKPITLVCLYNALQSSQICWFKTRCSI